jgi:hypothetical protein
LLVLLLQGAIIIDESLTSGGTYWDQSVGCPQFSHLTLTGGAIGVDPVRCKYHGSITSTSVFLNPNLKPAVNDISAR